MWDQGLMNLVMEQIVDVKIHGCGKCEREHLIFPYQIDTEVREWQEREREVYFRLIWSAY